jgi:hypothetical protein
MCCSVLFTEEISTAVAAVNYISATADIVPQQGGSPHRTRQHETPATKFHPIRWAAVHNTMTPGKGGSLWTHYISRTTSKLVPDSLHSLPLTLSGSDLYVWSWKALSVTQEVVVASGHPY